MIKITDISKAKRQTMIKFIEATNQIIEDDGLSNLTIRKIAEKTGLHNSTIYVHFSDLTELIMLASVKHFREYSKMLSQYSKKNLSKTETFLAIWELFMEFSIKNPCIFYNFFFNQKNADLHEILILYYNLFPDEKNSLSDEIEHMFLGKNIYERSMTILSPLLEEQNSVNEDNVHIVNDLIISYCKTILNKKCMDDSLDEKELQRNFLMALRLIIH